MSHQEYVGRSETREDRVDPRLVAGMAATLGRPAPAGDGTLPPLWHWMLFQDWKPPAELGPDGHPRRGGFLPPVHDLPRRMWAGGRLEFGATPLRVGDDVRRVSTILKVEEKAGGSGRLVFVTVRHEIAGPRGPALAEEHDIVYRGTGGAAVRPAEPAPPLAPARFDATLTPDAVLLFRYSALTGNGHRIHYDHPYVTGVEGYPGLVVHGPLQVTLLLHHLLDHAPAGRRIAGLSFRGRRPCFADRRLTLTGALSADGTAARIETRDEAGATCMQAEARLA